MKKGSTVVLQAPPPVATTEDILSNPSFKNNNPILEPSSSPAAQISSAENLFQHRQQHQQQHQKFILGGILDGEEEDEEEDLQYHLILMKSLKKLERHQKQEIDTPRASASAASIPLSSSSPSSNPQKNITEATLQESSPRKHQKSPTSTSSSNPQPSPRKIQHNHISQDFSRDNKIGGNTISATSPDESQNQKPKPNGNGNSSPGSSGIMKLLSVFKTTGPTKLTNKYKSNPSEISPDSSSSSHSISIFEKEEGGIQESKVLSQEAASDEKKSFEDSNHIIRIPPPLPAEQQQAQQLKQPNESIQDASASPLKKLRPKSLFLTRLGSKKEKPVSLIPAQDDSVSINVSERPDITRQHDNLLEVSQSPNSASFSPDPSFPLSSVDLDEQYHTVVRPTRRIIVRDMATQFDSRRRSSSSSSSSSSSLSSSTASTPGSSNSKRKGQGSDREHKHERRNSSTRKNSIHKIDPSYDKHGSGAQDSMGSSSSASSSPFSASPSYLSRSLKKMEIEIEDAKVVQSPMNSKESSIVFIDNDRRISTPFSSSAVETSSPDTPVIFIDNNKFVSHHPNSDRHSPLLSARKPKIDTTHLAPPTSVSPASASSSASSSRFEKEDPDFRESKGAETSVEGQLEDVQFFRYCRNDRYKELKESIASNSFPISRVDIRDVYGNTGFMIACQNGNKHVAKVLLRCSADIDAQNVSLKSRRRGRF